MWQKVFQQNIDTWHVVIWPRIHCQSLEKPCSATKSNLFGFPPSKKLDKIGTKKSRAQTDLMTKVIYARMDILTPFDKRAQNFRIDPGIINALTYNSNFFDFFLPKIAFVLVEQNGFQTAFSGLKPMRAIIYLDGKAILLYVLVVQYISISVRGLYICWQKRV